jgi:isopentenyl diphosphate isomerase/L-lactate dehydrogenase-like FMN-dependent dehydrogenase
MIGAQCSILRRATTYTLACKGAEKTAQIVQRSIRDRFRRALRFLDAKQLRAARDLALSGAMCATACTIVAA